MSGRGEEAGRLRGWVIPALLMGLGTALIFQSIADARATRWVLEDLRYTDVELRSGHRSPPVIHIVSDEGDRLVIPERLWRGRMEARELVRRLRSGSTVTVHLVGGEDRWLHGYPVVERLSLPDTTLAVESRPALVRLLRGVLGPLLLVLGALYSPAARRGRRRSPKRCRS